jgi:hypothetical protein
MLGSNMSYTSRDLTGILLHGQYFFVNQFFFVLTVSFPVKRLHYSECVFVCLSVSLLQRCRFLLFPMWVSVQILSSKLILQLGS